MRALFDVNFLLAVLDAQHMRNADARSWWADNTLHGWASCPLTQNGFLRISSQHGYANSISSIEAMTILSNAVQEPEHTFWPDDISLTDTDLINHAAIFGPKQLTDIYLLALATRNGGRLVTFDRAISIATVKGATMDNLVIL